MSQARACAHSRLTADGLMPRGGPESMAQAVGGTALGGAELARHFTNAFALKAKARFRA